MTNRAAQLVSETLRDLSELRAEAYLVDGAPFKADANQLPQTLYGLVMAGFAQLDLVSTYRYGPQKQTQRMRRFLIEYMGADAVCSEVAVQLWRHTLMHTAKPRPIIVSSGKGYSYLLHWGDWLPREQHMTIQAESSTLNFALLYFLEDLETAANAAFSEMLSAEELCAKLIANHDQLLAHQASR